MLTGYTIVLGISGGIAAYKAADLTSRLRKLNADVRVIMTDAAAKLISPLTLRELSGGPVVVDMFAEVSHWQVQHVALAKAADLLVVAPATANIIGKIACGIADDMLTTTVLAAQAPILLAPAMNANMYRNQVVQENLARLQRRGVHIIGPESGHLLCGDDDIGRMSEPGTIVERICELLARRRDMAGLRVLVTAGGTREPIDPVRYIGNRSSGRMGYALAEAAHLRGANVTLVSAPSAQGLAVPAGVEVVPVTTALEMMQAVMERFETADIVVKAAAVADFRPEVASDHKIKKRDLTQSALEIRLVPNPDIAAELGRIKKSQIIVAFAAETENLRANARDKMIQKNVDMIVANDVTEPGSGFESSQDRVTIITPAGERELPLLSKRLVAEEIFNDVIQLVAEKGLRR